VSLTSDILCVTQMLVLIIIIMIGQLFYTYLMASITASITNKDAARARFTERVAHAKRYILLQVGTVLKLNTKC